MASQPVTERNLMQQKLAEKREKLAQLRQKAQVVTTAAADLVSPTSATAPRVGATTTDTRAVDDLVSELLSETAPPVVISGGVAIPSLALGSVTTGGAAAAGTTAATAAPTSVPSINAASTAGVPVASAGPETLLSPRRKPVISLTMSETAFEFTIAPKAVEKFAKHTQTREAGVSQEDMEAQEASADTEAPELRLATDEEREAIESREDYVEFVKRGAEVLESLLPHNQQQHGGAAGRKGTDALDDMILRTSSSSFEGIRLLNAYYDETLCNGRAITAIDASPSRSDLFVASYVAAAAPSVEAGVVLGWSHHNPSQVEFSLECPSPVMSLLFHPYEENDLLIGGTYGGGLMFWDFRTRNHPIIRTTLAGTTSHSHPIYSMVVTGSSISNNLITASTDGVICVWSTANLTEPVERLEMIPNDGTRGLPITALAVARDETRQFQLGGEDGFLSMVTRAATIDRKAVTEKEGAKKVRDERRNRAHFGPITSMSFHPGTVSGDLSDLLLTTSFDWTAKLWSVQTSGTTLKASFEDASDAVMDAQWSPVHPALFATGDTDGNVCLWNMNDSMEVPRVKHRLGDTAVNRLRWSLEGRRLAVGDTSGTLSLFEVSSRLVNARQDEAVQLQRRLRESSSSASVAAAAAATAPTTGATATPSTST